MTPDRRGFLKTIIGTSLLGLFWPEKLKGVDLMPPPTDKPEVPDTREKRAEGPTLPPAPHERGGHFCPFSGQHVEAGSCPCAWCHKAREQYWKDVETRAGGYYGYRVIPITGTIVPYTATAQGYLPGVTAWSTAYGNAWQTGQSVTNTTSST